MKIAVCIKPVPSSDARITITDASSGVDASVYAKRMLNTYDECAIEAAVKLKEQGLADEVIVFTIAADDKGTKDQMVTSLAKGADRAMLVNNAEFNNADCLGVAKVLAALANKEDVQVIFCGKQSMDGEHSQVPSMLGEMLGWSTVTSISHLDVDGSDFTVHSELGSGNKAVLKGSFPVVISCDKNLNKPRNPNLKAKMAAKKKPIEKLSLGDLDLDNDGVSSTLVTDTNWTLPPQREECKFLDPGDIDAAVSELLSLLKNEAKVL